MKAELRVWPLPLPWILVITCLIRVENRRNRTEYSVVCFVKCEIVPNSLFLIRMHGEIRFDRNK